MPHTHASNCSKSPHSIAETACDTKSLGMCGRLLELAGLDDVLRGEGEFTLFAPTDDAFLELPPGTLESLERSREELRDMLSYHILETGRELAELRNGKLRTLQGELLTATVTDDGVNLDHASTCGYGVRCTNGLIHPIDRVLFPGFMPTLSVKARALSAWSGQRPAAHIPKAKPDDWPFVEPPAAANGSSDPAE